MSKTLKIIKLEISAYKIRNISLDSSNLSFSEFIQYPVIVRLGGPTPAPFLRHPPLDPACPSFQNLCFPYPLFCSNLFSGILDSFPHPLTQPPPAVIRPSKLPWFKQISKGRFYQFNCRFLSKINF